VTGRQAVVWVGLKNPISPYHGAFVVTA